ncbi:MAG: hypothetical protein H6830_10015 [Planctomycetes bacterium]|nr:hypothetical protein [Planctomycetota bacterium]MCB9909449.1 hypothetical protein [Planctomycetota bacterium]HPF13017.1 hypothetical protein [Planctomycetota bacterium]
MGVVALAPLWVGGCDRTQAPPLGFADAPDPTAQVADAGIVAYGMRGEFRGAQFGAQLRPALLNEARRHFDEAAWTHKWGTDQGTLWVLSLEVAVDSPAALELDGLTLEATANGAVQRLRFQDPGEGSGTAHVHDPLAVLLSAPHGALEAGGREWLGLLGPDALVEPALLLGSERFAMTPSTWESAKAPEDLPLLHRPLPAAR